MTQYSLGTVGFEIQNTGGPQATAEINNLANAATTKLAPAMKDVIAQLQFVSRVNKQVAQTTKELTYETAALSAVQLRQAASGLQNYEAALANTRRGMGEMGMATQQVGYQVGDFLVQIQSGTSPLVAFGQQATQLVGILPAFSGVLGMSVGSLVALSSALGIAIPLLTAIGAVFLRTSEESNTAAKAIDQQKQAYDALVESIQNVRLEREMLLSGAGTTEEQAVLNNINQLELERLVLQSQLESLNREANETASQTLAIKIQENLAAQEANQLEIEKNQNILGILERERERLESLERQKQAHADQVRFMGEALNSQRLMTIAAEEALGKYSMMRSVAAGLADELARGAANTRAMHLANQVAARIGDDERGSQREGLRDIAELRTKQALERLGLTPSGERVPNRTRGGGGGSRANTRIDSLINQLQTEREVLDEWYATSQDTLMLASESELAIIGGYNEAKLRLEQEYQDRLKNIRDESNNTALTDAANFFGGLAAVTENGGERLVKATQTFAAIEALINTYRAQAQVLADPTLGFFGKAAAYLQIGAAGLNVVRAIKGVSGGGSGSAGSARGSATVAPTASAPTPQTVMIDSIDPDSLYSGQTLINLFDAFYDENDKRGKVFLVAR